MIKMTVKHKEMNIDDIVEKLKQKAIKKIVRNFKKKHPGKKVKVTIVNK